MDLVNFSCGILEEEEEELEEDGFTERQFSSVLKARHCSLNCVCVCVRV